MLRVKHDQSGFSLAELATTLVVMGFLIGMGVWVLLGTGSASGAKSAQGQIAQDLRLCAKMAETTKKPWGILFYAKGYPNATWHNVYRWYYFNGYGDDEADADCNIVWQAPPKGATPAQLHVYRVPLPDDANLFGTYGSAWPSSTHYVYLRFKPEGASMVTQYGRWSGARVWTDIADSPGYLKIDVSDRKEDATRSVRVYKLGDIWLK